MHKSCLDGLPVHALIDGCESRGWLSQRFLVVHRDAGYNLAFPSMDPCPAHLEARNVEPTFELRLQVPEFHKHIVSTCAFLSVFRLLRCALRRCLGCALRCTCKLLASCLRESLSRSELSHGVSMSLALFLRLSCSCHDHYSWTALSVHLSVIAVDPLTNHRHIPGT